MKRIVLTIPLFFVIVFLFGQTWNTLIPYETTCPECTLKKLIKTQDDGFLVLINKVEQIDFQKNIHSMYKYTSEGELEWEKDYDFGVISGGGLSNIGGGQPLDALQLENGNFFMTGKYTDSDTMFMYVFVTDSNGDSLSLKQIPGTFNLNYVNGNLYTRNIDMMDSHFFLKLDEWGEVETEFLIDEEVVWRTIVNTNNEIFLFRGLGIGRGIKKLSIDGELLIDNVEFDNLVDHVAINELNGVTTFEEELRKIDNNLNVVWEIPFEEIFSTGAPINYDASGIVSTSDNGYLLTGHFQTTNVYIIKRDKEGDYEWGGIYGSSYLPLTHIGGIVEVEDGYVLVGGNRYSEQLWLVKLNEEGLFTNTEEIAGKIIDIKLYPNPVEGELTISLSTPFTGQINIFNSLGQLLQNESVDNIRQINFPLTDFPSAYYWIELQTPENRITLPFVKQ